MIDEFDLDQDGEISEAEFVSLRVEVYATPYTQHGTDSLVF